MSAGRAFVLVAGRWDSTLTAIDLDAALEGRPAIVSRPRVTRDVRTSQGTAPACGLPVSIAAAGERIFVVNHAGNATSEATAIMPHGHAGTIAMLDARRALDPAFDGTTDALTGFLDPGGCGPVGCALTPDGRFLLVTTAEGDGTEDGGSGIAVFDARTGALLRRHALRHGEPPCPVPSPHPGFGKYPNPNGIAVAAAHGGLVFTANGGTDDVSVLKLGALLDGDPAAEIARVPLPSGPFGLAVSPDARLLAVANRESARTGREGNTVSLIDVAATLEDPARAVRATVLVGTDDSAVPTRPADVTFSPDGRTLYATATRAGTVSAVDVTEALSGGRGERRRIELTRRDGTTPAPRGIRTTRDGRLVLVSGGTRAASRSGALWVLDAGNLFQRACVEGVGNEPYLLEVAAL